METQNQQTSEHVEPPPPEIEGRSLWSDARKRIRGDWTAMACVAIIALYSLVAIGGIVYEIVAEHSDSVPTFQEMKDYSHKSEPPSLRSWKTILGTDWAGRSVLIKIFLGAKISMSVGVIVNVIAIPVGMILGAIAGYYGGKIDAMIVWLFSTLASIPGIIFLIAIRYAFKNVTIGPFELGGITIGPLDLGGIHGVYIALAFIGWTGICRLVRAETLKLRELDYVLAARAAGRGRFAILTRHILPNVAHLGVIRFSLGFVGAVQAEVILSYLGLGVAVGIPSWGSMINSARMDLFTGKWWELASAVGAIFFLVLALNILGDRLRDALDPRLRNV